MSEELEQPIIPLVRPILNPNGTIFGPVLNDKRVMPSDPLWFFKDRLEPFILPKFVVKIPEPWVDENGSPRTDSPPEDYGSDLITIENEEIMAYTFYVDSVPWDDTDMWRYTSTSAEKNACYDKMDKSGDGTKENPWRNACYALDRLNCVLNQKVYGKRIDEEGNVKYSNYYRCPCTCIRLVLTGTIDYVITAHSATINNESTKYFIIDGTAVDSIAGISRLNYFYFYNCKIKLNRPVYRNTLWSISSYFYNCACVCDSFTPDTYDAYYNIYENCKLYNYTMDINSANFTDRVAYPILWKNNIVSHCTIRANGEGKIGGCEHNGGYYNDYNIFYHFTNFLGEMKLLNVYSSSTHSYNDPSEYYNSSIVGIFEPHSYPRIYGIYQYESNLAKKACFYNCLVDITSTDYWLNAVYGGYDLNMFNCTIKAYMNCKSYHLYVDGPWIPHSVDCYIYIEVTNSPHGINSHDITGPALYRAFNCVIEIADKCEYGGAPMDIMGIRDPIFNQSIYENCKLTITKYSVVDDTYVTIYGFTRNTYKNCQLNISIKGVDKYAVCPIMAGANILNVDTNIGCGYTLSSNEKDKEEWCKGCL